MNPPPSRLISLDAYRGLVMFLMAAEVLHLSEVATHFPGNAFWEAVRFHTSHVDWAGCSLHDLIQPSFSFLVGVALPFSLASRIARGVSKASLWGHALWRAVALVILGIVLRSMGQSQTYWTFEDTLTQIGLGYPLLFALGWAGARARWLAFAGILLGYWLLFVLWNGSSHAESQWSHDATGFAAHWNLNANPAWTFDQWFLNLFPRESPFVTHEEGYSTLNFIPTLATMILGLIAGQWIRDRQNSLEVVKKLCVAGAACLTLGCLWHLSGSCPAIKKIWTPSWTLLSGGWCVLLLAGFFYVIDVNGWRRWAFGFVVFGLNSITIYVMTWTTHSFFEEMLTTHFRTSWFGILGEAFEPMLKGAPVLFIWWMILFWMHRRRIYLRF